MLEILSPVALVACTVDMIVDTVPVCFIVDPLSLVDISVDMREFTLSMRSVIFPFSLVYGTVSPFLHTSAISESTLPLSIIGGSRLESVSCPVFPSCLWVVGSVLGYGLSGLVDCEVSAVSPFGFQNESSIPSGNMTSEDGLDLDNQVDVRVEPIHVKLSQCSLLSATTAIAITGLASIQAHLIIAIILVGLVTTILPLHETLVALPLAITFILGICELFSSSISVSILIFS